MWTPCQVTVVLCRCSAKGSTAFTVQVKARGSSRPGPDPKGEGPVEMLSKGEYRIHSSS